MLLFTTFYVFSVDIGVCETVLKTKSKENFERRLQAEHSKSIRAKMIASSSAILLQRR